MDINTFYRRIGWYCKKTGCSKCQFKRYCYMAPNGITNKEIGEMCRYTMQLTENYSVQEGAEKGVFAKDFFKNLRSHCQNQGDIRQFNNCEHCCVRLFCNLPPSDITDRIIADVWFYFWQSKSRKM